MRNLCSLAPHTVGSTYASVLTARGGVPLPRATRPEQTFANASTETVESGLAANPLLEKPDVVFFRNLETFSLMFFISTYAIETNFGVSVPLLRPDVQLTVNDDTPVTCTPTHGTKRKKPPIVRFEEDANLSTDPDVLSAEDTLPSEDELLWETREQLVVKCINGNSLKRRTLSATKKKHSKHVHVQTSTSSSWCLLPHPLQRVSGLICSFATVYLMNYLKSSSY